MIEDLKKIYENLLKHIDDSFHRDAESTIDPSQHGPIVVVGERGVWKTYLLLQKLKQQTKKSFYFSADNPLIQWTTLIKLVSDLYFDYWIRFLAIDEIHRWDNWIDNLKSIIDSFPDLELIVSGSSSLDLYKGTSDLQRRIHKIDLFPLSFAEYLLYEHDIQLPSYSFEDIITDYKEISYDLSNKFQEQHFKAYLAHGYYPYFKHKQEIYHNLLLNNLKKTILEDLPTFMNLQTSSLSKLEKLFYFVAHNPPSELNYKSLAEKIGISKDLLESIIYYLDQIGVLNIAIRSNKLTNIVRKEFKIFLGNPNMYYAYQAEDNRGTLRESLVLHTLKKLQKSSPINEHIILPEYGDIIFTYQWVQYLFEVGWKHKTSKQIKWIQNSFLVVDDIIWTDNKIPLWLFGLIDKESGELSVNNYQLTIKN